MYHLYIVVQAGVKIRLPHATCSLQQYGNRLRVVETNLSCHAGYNPILVKIYRDQESCTHMQFNALNPTRYCFVQLDDFLWVSGYLYECRVWHIFAGWQQHQPGFDDTDWDDLRTWVRHDFSHQALSKGAREV